MSSATYRRAPSRRGRPAVALLEVVLALAVFFGVAITILGGLSLSMQSGRQVKEEAKGADLATTLLSEIQIGLYIATDAGPTPFDDPDADWTWQVVTAPVDTAVTGVEFTQVQIIIRNTLTNYTYRLYGMLPAEDDTAAVAAAGGADAGGAP